MLSFEINGRKVSSAQFAREMQSELEKTFVRGIEEEVTKQLRTLRCGEHHSAPRVTMKGKSLSALSMELDTCCDALMERAKAALEITD